VTTARTVISLRVSVPVLSEAITVAEPSVSTAESWRTIALRRAMRRTPTRAPRSTMVGSPSGTAATASATPSSRPRSSAETPRTCSHQTIAAIIATAMPTTTEPSTLPTSIQLALQRRGLVRGGSEHARDAPHLGVHPGRDDDASVRGRR
jgi:hypothetical protein